MRQFSPKVKCRRRDGGEYGIESRTFLKRGDREIIMSIRNGGPSQTRGLLYLGSIRCDTREEKPKGAVSGLSTSISEKEEAMEHQAWSTCMYGVCMDVWMYDVWSPGNPAWSNTMPTIRVEGDETGGKRGKKEEGGTVPRSTSSTVVEQQSKVSSLFQLLQSQYEASNTTAVAWTQDGQGTRGGDDD